LSTPENTSSGSDGSRKYAIVIPDGCADEPQDAFGGRTPLQAADTPNMDRIGRAGLLGMTLNTPEGLAAGSDVATMSLFGYDPVQYYTGRAPLEAAAQGITLGPDDWAFRCNLVTVHGDRMVDYSAGHIRSEEAVILMQKLQAEYGGRHLQFMPGVSYRNLMLYRATDQPPLFGPDLVTQPPHDIPDEPISDYMPSGSGSAMLMELMLGCRTLLETHEVNAVRMDLGENPGNMIWLWGQGQAPSVPSFQQRFGLRGAIISAVDLTRGLGTVIGWEPIDVPTATGYLDTDYAAKGRAAVEALKDYDLVCVHVEAPDEASHEGNLKAKVEALERIDAEVVGPVLDALQAYPYHRILVSPDHQTPVRKRTHVHGPVPFAICGTRVANTGAGPYHERQAQSAGLVVEFGHELIEFFLKD